MGEERFVDEERERNPGRGTGRQGPWARDEDEDAGRATKQEGDPHALDVEGDPRGGVQSDEYRHAEPRDVVEEGDVAMSGPAGAPQEGKSVEERRAESEEWRRHKFTDADADAGPPEKAEP